LNGPILAPLNETLRVGLQPEKSELGRFPKENASVSTSDIVHSLREEGNGIAIQLRHTKLETHISAIDQH